MKLVVTDTGPLLHLYQAGAVDLLAHLGDVHVTSVVWSELHRHAPSFQATGHPPWLKLVRPSVAATRQAAEWVQARVLDAGEAEALAYAQESQADLFLSKKRCQAFYATALGELVHFEQVPCSGST